MQHDLFLADQADATTDQDRRVVALSPAQQDWFQNTATVFRGIEAQTIRPTAQDLNSERWKNLSDLDFIDRNRIRPGHILLCLKPY